MIDLDRLVAWLDAKGLPGAGEPLEHRFIAGGSQNEIYEIRRGDLHAALRIPPPPAPASRDDGIMREWRIIEALAGTDVPHTPAIAACEDTAVLGRAFYLMGFVEGWSPMGLTDRAWPAPFDTDLDARRGLAFQLVEGIALRDSLTLADRLGEWPEVAAAIVAVAAMIASAVLATRRRPSGPSSAEAE